MLSMFVILVWYSSTDPPSPFSQPGWEFKVQPAREFTKRWKYHKMIEAIIPCSYCDYKTNFNDNNIAVNSYVLHWHLKGEIWKDGTLFEWFNFQRFLFGLRKHQSFLLAKEQ